MAKKLHNPLTSFVKEAFVELKKVAWPKRSEVVTKTLLVIFSIIIIAAITGALDYGLYAGVKYLIALNK
ncbi:MAG TPA: preprotein translocase subunit SecE [Patescibacteria group bacterium]|nr:preprotein translocase subunit SecE [Patescibacteria group bacterium]